MPEMKNNFQRGRMNKDLDERLVPNGEYRDALNVEIATSNDSDMGTLQTLKGNTFLGVDGIGGVCIGSIADDKNDKLYFMVAGYDYDRIIEYNYKDEEFLPVCIDHHSFTGRRALNFNANFLITGINIIDDLLFWTDNNSEPKKINITRGKLGSVDFAGTGLPSFTLHTKLMVKDLSPTAPPNTYTSALDQDQDPIDIHEKYLTVIKKGPSAAPVLEMIDTLADGMIDGDGLAGGGEVSAIISNASSLAFLDANGDFVTTNLSIQVNSGMDFPPGAFLNIYKTDDRSVNVRVQIISIVNAYPTGVPSSPYNTIFEVEIKSGNKEIQGEEGLTVELEQADALFQFKFPRFAYRYKYEDGEYSCFSPFTEPAFIPGRFNFLPKEGYNLGMVNKLRRLAIKDFVHERSMGEDVVAIDILYKESNSPNIYSVKTVKRTSYWPTTWDAWNGDSSTTVVNTGASYGDGWRGITKGYLPITTEMIHAVLPSNQLLRPWDNVPRKALAQEVIGNRLVYGNYLQNYDLKKYLGSSGPNNIKVDIKVRANSDDMGNVAPEELHAGNKRFMDYKPTKSVKTLRTYQLGVVYIDKYGRETPVFSEDKRGATSAESTSESSVYIKKENANKRNQLIVKMKSDPPEWATHRKYFIKETSNEYYNLAMDRCYDAEDGNIWMSFPSAERNKVDEDTYLILKKAHDSDQLVLEPAKYKIIAIENEAPRFIKLKNISIGAIQDDKSIPVIGTATEGFPFENGTFILIDKVTANTAKWDEKLFNTDISQVFLRVKTPSSSSLWYRIRTVTLTTGGSHYKIEVDKKFGPDMGITSVVAGDWITRNTCSVEVVKRLPEDRAEFGGRFFVKILKDATIKATVCPDISLDANLQPISSITVQYIDPMQSNVIGGGWIQDDVPGELNWFGQDKLKLSVDKNNNVSELGNDYNGDPGHGYKYWSKASNDTSTGASSPKSSGWFIDKVEAFRPWKGSIDGQTKTIGHRWNNAGDAPSTVCNPWYIDSGNFDGKPLNALGLNTNGDAGNVYLDYNNTRPPIVGTTANPNNTLIRQASVADGGKVAPSVGIDVASGIINLSHSGIGIKDSGSTDYPTNSNLDAVHADGNFAAVPAKHTGDELFINKLTAPGTIWRWKEDPDQILYITVLNTDFSTGDPYTQDEWDQENNGDLDGFEGVYLFNYAMFADYYLKPHHTYTGYVEFFGTNWIPPITDEKWDFVSRKYGDHYFVWDCFGPVTCGTAVIAAGTGVNTWCPFQKHDEPASKDHGSLGNWDDPHKRFPTGIYDWDHQVNKRRRFVFKSEVYKDMNGAVKGGLLGSGDHGYLPTNDPSLPAHFDAEGNVITEYPSGVPTLGGTTFASQNLVAPGIRNDGMHAGYDYPGGSYAWDPDGNGTQPQEEIPLLKRWSAATTPTNPAMAGSVTWEIMEPFTEADDRMASKNPAVWETEPKEDVGLDLYHEVGQIYPIHLNSETIEQFVGAIHIDISKNSFVQCWHPTSGNHILNTGSNTDIRVFAAFGDYVMLGSVDNLGAVIQLDNTSSPVTPPIDSLLMFWRADGSETEARVVGFDTTLSPNGTWYKLAGNGIGVHNEEVRLPWFNCYSFGNGVESDRIRDDYNQVTIDNGPKASTTIEEPYLEERRKNGFIWSGLYNSISGVNNTNQFIQAEKITKDVNPTYGSIQKLFARDSDLVAFCEDRVLKVLANKDALYNADGNTNLIATDRVLGATRPFSGDYGISLNPESFASDSYRSYFSDISRGAILRLSQDGLTPVSDAGMHDWFADNLPLYNKIIGSFDDNKGEYNITLHPKISKIGVEGHPPTTLSYSEKAKGWISFKSWIQENGVSLNNSYYTFSGGQMFQHHTNEIRNNFYSTPIEDYQYESSVDILFNQVPSSMKSFSTLNYEGSQARITPDINDNPDYYDNFPKDGWYVKEMISNAQELGEMEFWDKEDKWFSQIKGVKTEWLDDGTAGNIDPREFSYQGIGNASDVSCPNCPEVTSWNCNHGNCIDPGDGSGQYSTLVACNTACGQTVQSWDCLGDCNTIAGGIYGTDCGCVELSDDSGQYTTLASCFAACGNIVGMDWECVGGNCLDVGIGNGSYNSEADCINGCSLPPLWICGPIVGGGVTNNCTQVFPGDFGYAGAFTSETQCNTNCQVYGCTDPLALNYYAGASVDDGSCYYPTWDCINGVCTDNFLGTGTYNSWSACDTACVTSSPDNWLCHAGGCTPTSIPVNTIAGVFATLSACQTACSYSPCPDFTTSNYTLLQNQPNWECSNSYVDWSVNIPNFQPGDSWVYAITSDSSGTIVAQSNNPSTSSSGGSWLGNGIFTAGNYTMEITHTLASGEACTYAFPIIISCIG